MFRCRSSCPSTSSTSWTQMRFSWEKSPCWSREDLMCTGTQRLPLSFHEVEKNRFGSRLDNMHYQAKRFTVHELTCWFITNQIRLLNLDELWWKRLFLVLLPNLNIKLCHVLKPLCVLQWTGSIFFPSFHGDARCSGRHSFSHSILPHIDVWWNFCCFADVDCFFLQLQVLLTFKGKITRDKCQWFDCICAQSGNSMLCHWLLWKTSTRHGEIRQRKQKGITL